MCFISYSKSSEILKLYSLQRRREIYGIIYVWKIIEGMVPNLSDPITCSFSDRLLRRLMIYFSNCQYSIMAHVWHRAFETLQIELYRVVDYDSKWPTKFHKECMLEFFLLNF